MIRELRTRVEQFRISGDRRQMEAIGTIKQEIDRWMAEMVQWSFTPREHELSSQARRGWQSLREKIERISNNPTSMTPEELDQLENLLKRMDQ